MRERNDIWLIRWVLVALAFVLGLVLLFEGHPILGGVVTLMAVLRVVLFVRIRGRRKELRERFGRRPLA